MDAGGVCNSRSPQDLLPSMQCDRRWVFERSHLLLSGPGGVVGIATGYGLDGSGIKSRWGRDFLHLSRPALGPTQSPVQWIPGFSRGYKERLGRDADPSPPSSALGHERVELYLYFPYGPYGLYKGAFYLYHLLLRCAVQYEQLGSGLRKSQC
jgi:hypothetical protein